MPSGSSATSSSISVPPCAASNRPSFSPVAPVNAPFTWPKSSDSISVSGIAPQFTATNACSARGDSSCSARAASSLPVPDSPTSSTLVRAGAILRSMSNTRCIAADLPSRRSRR